MLTLSISTKIAYWNYIMNGYSWLKESITTNIEGKEDSVNLDDMISWRVIDFLDEIEIDFSVKDIMTFVISLYTDYPETLPKVYSQDSGNRKGEDIIEDMHEVIKSYMYEVLTKRLDNYFKEIL